MLKKLRLRLRALFFKSKMEDDLQAELRFHLEREIEENIIRGMTPEEARCAAIRTFGSVERVKEESRDVRGIRLLEELGQDLRYGMRMLLKQPGFTLVVVVTLALGIGANTVVFSLLDAVLLKTLPVKEPERLVLFRLLSGEKSIFSSGTSDVGGGLDQATGLKISTSFPYPAFEYFRARNQSLSDVFAFALLRQVNVSVDGHPEIVVGQVVSGDYFAGLGLPALLGRILMDADDRADAAPAAVISYKYWQRRFGGDPAAVGKVVYLSDTAFTIAGVTPPEFYGTLDVGRIPDISVPMAQLPQIQPQIYPLGDTGYTWMNSVLALRRRAWGPPFAYPPLMSYTFFTEALNEICDSI
jgi:MacB-like protein